MPFAYDSTYEVHGWDSADFAGPVTGGSNSGFFHSVGVIFTPTVSGSTQGSPTTWLTGWRPGGNLTVRISCTPNAAINNGWVAFSKWDGGILGLTDCNLTGGGPIDVVLPASAVTTDIRGIQVFAGDNAIAHFFTLHSVSVDVPAVTGVLSVGLQIAIDHKVKLPLAIDISAPLAVGLSISVFSDQVFAGNVSAGAAVFAGSAGSNVAAGYTGGAGYARWSPHVLINSLVVTEQLTGTLSVQAGEDSARTASLSLVAPSVAWLLALENASVVIEAIMQSSAGLAQRRIFTGKVETHDYSAVDRVVTLACRDGWQERPKACTTPAEVDALFAGLAKNSPLIHEWNEEPDATGYFAGLLETLPGASCIDASGLWKIIPWQIGTPVATLTDADIDDGSLSLSIPRRADFPGKIAAVLNHRHLRLHQAEVPLSWERVDYVYYVLYGWPALAKQTVIAALNGLSDWHVKGEPYLESPVPGTYMVSINAQAIPYIVPVVGNDLLCQTLNATMYRRWYQEVESSYTFEIAFAGGSDRTDTVSASIASDFDGPDWEQTPSSEASIGVYSANPPPALQGAPVLTGYEGLKDPLIPANGGFDFWNGTTQSEIDDAMACLVAKAVRNAAKAMRTRQVKITKPLDLRFELGDVLALDCYGVQATGQISEVRFDMDIDTGDAVSGYTLAVPDSVVSATASTTTVTPPLPIVAHALAAPVLGNWYGARTDTPTAIDTNLLQGFLFNTLPTGNDYSANTPAYHEQFRIIMPAIADTHRDGLKQAGTVNATWSIAGGQLSITF